MENFADRLFASVKEKQTPLCLGIDPRWDLLPRTFNAFSTCGLRIQAQSVLMFCCELLDLVGDKVACVKLNSAFFECCGDTGFANLKTVIQQAHAIHLPVILDVKRGDIAETANAYAEAAFDYFCADAVTVNPYMGEDAIRPFIRPGRGVFVLARTSNPSAKTLQESRWSDQAHLFVKVATMVEKISLEQPGSLTCCASRGKSGWSSVGMVVGATAPDEIATLRKMCSDLPFLIPGYGTQGGTAEAVSLALRPDGTGAIVNSSRGLAFPYAPEDTDWREKIIAAVDKARKDLAFVPENPAMRAAVTTPSPEGDGFSGQRSDSA